jgi:LAO/AO transport system kinase
MLPYDTPSTQDEPQQDSALSIATGVESLGPVNPRLRFARRKRLTVQDYFDGIRNRDRVIFAQAITLLESTRPEDQRMARELVSACMPYTGQSVRIGITGVPGVGKSTFIEAFGTYLIDTLGRNLAVLAVDPTSQRSRGSILGDKTRMAELSTRREAFIRPSPSACTLGGVTQATREAILLCEAAGFETILIETVGVGQSETAVHGMVDFFLLLMLAGAGDEIQGIKRGIMEMADGVVITKADGANANNALVARQEYANALHLFPRSASNWVPKVLTCSSTQKSGIADVWSMIADYEQLLKSNGFWETKRQAQLKDWMHESILQQLQTDFFSHPRIQQRIEPLEIAVLSGQISPFQAAEKLMALYQKASTIVD